MRVSRKVSSADLEKKMSSYDGNRPDARSLKPNRSIGRT